MLEIRRCTITEIEGAPNVAAILAEYARESALPELGEPHAQFGTYRNLEAAGVMHPFGAFEDGLLNGIILPIVVVLPHYGVLAATVESWFVPRLSRKKGIGLRLLAAAEELARGLGAKALLLSAPTGGRLARVMPSLPYRHSNDVFVRAL